MVAVRTNNKHYIFFVYEIFKLQANKIVVTIMHTRAQAYIFF